MKDWLFWLRTWASEHRFLLVIIIMFAGLVLRLWGINFGLPYLYHVDEHYYINTALKLGAGVINNPPYASAGLSNILFGEYGIYYALGRLFHFFSSSQAFELAFRSDPTVFYLLGRLTTAVLGAITILVLYFLGESTLGVIAGLTAAILLSTSFSHIRDSHYAVPDIAMPFFVVLAVALTAAAMHNGNRRYIFAASFIGGLAVAMKWTALPVVLAVGWAGIQMQTRMDKPALGNVLRFLTFCSVLFFLGFALGSPQVLVDPAPYLGLLGHKYGEGEVGGFDAWQVDTLPGWLFYAKTLFYGMGPILLSVGVVGVIRRLILIVRARDTVSILLLSFPVSYFLFMGFPVFVYFDRYALPLVPFVTLFAAETFVVLSEWAKAKWGRLGWGLVSVLALASVVQPLVNSIRYDILLTQQDTRTLAKEWIETNIPAESRIAVDWPVHDPPLSTKEKIMPYSERIYDVIEVDGAGLSDHALDWYREQGFDYLIASSFIYDIPLVDRELNAKRNIFYSSLDKELVLVQEFKPYQGDHEPSFIFEEIYGPAVSLWERERPGPTLKIYRVN